MRKLQDRFRQTSDTDGLRPVLILDEAQDLRPDTLAMLKVLTNFDMDSRLVLSIVLAGQPKLRDLLRLDDLEDVARRLAHYATLRTLTRDEIGRYIEHRCTIAGAASVPPRHPEEPLMDMQILPDLKGPADLKRLPIERLSPAYLGEHNFDVWTELAGLEMEQVAEAMSDGLFK